MRDIVIVLIVFGSVPMIFVRPQVGILMWFWLGMMNPHRLTWGYAQQLRVALVIGGVTLISWLISREPKRPPGTPVVWALAGYTFWFSLAALFALRPDLALPKWQEAIKILLMTFVTICIVQERERLTQLVWVICVSLGFYGIKGGIFSVLSGGSYRVYGPPDTFISENNALGLALIMIVPLMQYLRTTVTSRWINLGLIGAIGATIVSILGSWSRGALIGLSVMLFYMWLKTRHKLVTSLVAFGVLGGALMMLPQKWYDRMNTIETYDQDASALGRLDAWTFAFRLALDHPFTGGGQVITDDTVLFKQYVPTAPRARAAHSIYFETLGETGFVGLGFFLTLLATAYLTARGIVRSTRDRPELAWARQLASMLQVSIIGYAVTGAFLSLGTFDLYYALVALVAGLQVAVRRELAKAATDPTPAEPHAGMFDTAGKNPVSGTAIAPALEPQLAPASGNRFR